MFRKVGLFFLPVFLLTLAIGGIAWAEYPEKPITILVGHGAGGSTDTITRTFTPFLSKYLDNPVVVQNMKGGSGSIAMNQTYEAKPDGYTLNMVVVPSYIQVQLLRKPDWDVLKFTPIWGVGGGDSNGLIVGAKSKLDTFEKFLEATKGEKVTIAGTSPGSNSWLLTTLLRERAGLKFAYVPFDSGNEATMAVVGGHVTAGSASTVNFPDLVREGKINVLAVASKERLYYLPDTPTFKELGFPTVNIVTRQILMGPPGLPDEVIKKLAAAAEKAVKDPEFVELAKKQGFSIGSLNSEDAGKEVAEVYSDIKDLLEKAGELK